MSTPVRAPGPAVTAAAGPPRRAPRPYVAELRSGLAPWAAAVMFLTLLGPLVSKADQWQGSWAQTESELHIVAMVLGGPLAVAVGCWQGGREQRQRTAELRASASRGPLAQFLTASLPVGAGLAFGYLAASAVPLLATWPYASAGGPIPSAHFADALCLIAMTVVGHTVGRLLRWRLAAPLAALCAYVVLGVPTYQESGGARFLDPALQYAFGETVPVWWQPYAMTLWTCGLAATVVLLYAARRWARLSALLPLAAACAAAVLIVQSAGGMWREEPASLRQVCTGAAPQVCISAAYRDLLPQVSAALAGVTGRLDGVRNAPSRYGDLSDAARSDDVALPQLYLGSRSVVRGRLADPEEFAWMVGATLAYGACDPSGGAPWDSTSRAVHDWLVSNGLSERRRASDEEHSRSRGSASDIARDKKSRAALDRLRSMDPGKRRAWLGRYFAATRGHCDPSGVPTL